jgi:hypothetical protein
MLLMLFWITISERINLENKFKLSFAYSKFKKLLIFASWISTIILYADINQ